LEQKRKILQKRGKEENRKRPLGAEAARLGRKSREESKERKNVAGEKGGRGVASEKCCCELSYARKGTWL